MVFISFYNVRNDTVDDRVLSSSLHLAPSQMNTEVIIEHHLLGIVHTYMANLLQDILVMETRDQTYKAFALVAIPKHYWSFKHYSENKFT